MDTACRISRAANGYSVELRDPKIEQENRAKSGKPNYSWRDPNVSYVFEDMEAMLAFLKKTLPTALKPDEYATTYDKAVQESDDD